MQNTSDRSVTRPSFHHRSDLRLEDKVDGSWTKHFFSLYKTKITYTEISSDDRVGEDEEADDEEDVDDSTIEVDQPDDDKELHHEEPWFHGKLEGGRHAAAALLESAVTDLPPERRNGTFLVRESDTSEGFVVSVWCEDPDQVRCLSKPHRSALSPTGLPGQVVRVSATVN
jgi:hypothetical protein